jgi:hypothetical protein
MHEAPVIMTCLAGGVFGEMSGGGRCEERSDGAVTPLPGQTVDCGLWRGVVAAQEAADCGLLLLLIQDGHEFGAEGGVGGDRDEPSDAADFLLGGVCPVFQFCHLLVQAAVDVAVAA